MILIKLLDHKPGCRTYVFLHTNKCWQRTYPCLYLQTAFISKCREVIVIQNSKNPERQHFFLFFISVSLWSCLLWIILCSYFPPWYSKASRQYFSSSTVERMRNELWWSCCHGCLSPLSIGVIPPAADSGEKKSSVSGFPDTLLMKSCYKKKIDQSNEIHKHCGHNLDLPRWDNHLCLLAQN